MVVFNSYVKLPEGNWDINGDDVTGISSEIHGFSLGFFGGIPWDLFFMGYKW